MNWPMQYKPFGGLDERSEVLIQPGKGERSIIENDIKNKKLRVS